MDEERRLGPRRLLSFDASQMSLSRLGKVFQSGTHIGRGSTGRKPEPVSNHCVSVSYRSPTKPQYLCLAGNPDHRIAAAISKESVEVLGIEGAAIAPIRTTKINQKYLPTAAEWQGKHHWSHFSPSFNESLGDQTGAPQSGSVDSQAASPQGHSTSDAVKLVVADAGGFLRVYELNPTTGSLALTQTSSSSGRAINSVSFNSSQPNTMATAVSDGSVRLWDLRRPLKHPIQVFQRPGDIAREVQFQPEIEFKFACIHDSGVVQRWDTRQRQSPDSRISAHQQGLSLDWHPYLPYLATGGRDHLVQVWNMSSTNTNDSLSGAISPEYVISTPNSVSKVKWTALSGSEPLAKSMLITSGRPIESNSTKGSYSCWSLERPWIPQYTVEAHRDAVTDIFVAGPTTVWSVGRDGKFAQADLRYEPEVQRNLPPVMVEWPPWDIPATSFPSHTGNSAGSLLTSGTAIRSQTPSAGPASIHEGTVGHRRSSVAPVTPNGLHVNMGRTMSMANLSTSPSSIAFQLLGSSSTSLANSMNHSLHGAGSHNSTHLQTPRSATPGTPTGSTTGNYFHGLGDTNQLQYVIEVGLPFVSERTQFRVSSELLYTRSHGQSYADVCEHNAKALMKPELYQLAEIWKMLAVAVNDAETTFMETLTDKDEQELAEKWFAGYHDQTPTSAGDEADVAVTTEPIPAAADAGVSEDAETASLEDLEWGSAGNWEGASSLPYSNATNLSVDDSDASPSKWGSMANNAARKRSGNSNDMSSSTRPRRLLDTRKSALQLLKEKYRKHILQKSMPWEFMSLLKELLSRMVEFGFYVVAAAIILTFRGFSYALSDFNIGEIVEAALLSLNGTRSFVAASLIRNVISDDPDLTGSGIDLSGLLQDTIGTADIVCHRCQRSLSDNIAFYARNHAEVGFWYCSRCRMMLDGCSYCNEPVKGLGIVMLACGHRSHIPCWEQWTVKDEMKECPAGCGELITAPKVSSESATGADQRV